MVNLKIVLRLSLFAMIVTLFSGCASYTPAVLKSSDIAISGKINLIIDSVIVETAVQQSGGFVKGVDNLGKRKKKHGSKGNRIQLLKKYGFAGTLYSKWKTMIEDFAADPRLFNKNRSKVAVLRVSVLDIRFPGAGGKFPLYILAHYKLVDASTSKIIFSGDIKSHGTVGKPYPEGGRRLLDTLVRARNNNVKIFIETLSKHGGL